MTSDEPTPGDGVALAELLAANLEALDHEQAEIEMLAAQVRSEAARHEQRRATAAQKAASASRDPALKDVVELFSQLATMTRRAVMMEAQGDLLEAKGKALARHRAALTSFGEIAMALGVQRVVPPAADGTPDEESLPPSLPRVVLAAQEDLRREIARSMHDGPAQSLTNIVLQTQIVERLMDRDPASVRGELRLLASIVQQTLDTTKSFIFDVRPMVLDDLGLVPTLRRAARDRGRRAHVMVEFESHGQDRRLPMEIESAVFRMLDEVLVAYLAQSPERMVIGLDWSSELVASVTATRTPTYPPADDLPPAPDGDVPDTMRRMVQDRHDAHAAAIAAAEVAANIGLPATTRRDVAGRAASIGAAIEIRDAGEVRITVPLAEADAAGES